ncbi:oxidoreductase [Capsulimonas corticalis]|uniref:Oxidoreductase n=1 Tax=Capsulimonas corticalis TaxID=2219043 RepID=A0A402CVR4_9BACT|nr:Gfo/Idh/MocA family oxidoreductase [Capsulimonas corticalis]BDI30486.1 oxidoreductase [Capsulimonas corticalis]
MNKSRFVMMGAGFWARYQLAGWGEIEGAACVAICDRSREKAGALAREFGAPKVYEDAETALLRERPDFVDIVAGPEAHEALVLLAAEHRIPAICQKPLGPTVEAAERMAEACRAAGVPLYVHENWRWQEPIRIVRAILEEGAIGEIFRARIDFITGFPVFDNQPFLKELDQFLLTDIGTHILDTARFLFGEAKSVYCRTRRVHSDIRGEDVATVMMEMQSGVVVTCNMAYSGNPHEHDRFPETYLFLEGVEGALELAPDYWVRTTTRQGTWARRSPPARYSWADPAYDLVQASIVPCSRNLFVALNGGAPAETSAEDNLRTLRLVRAAYESAASGQVITQGL